uniref:Protein kinase domain-containing protein n=1 Tax=Helianthus annuus TaxID=4232 RepID=A0A251TTC5_HELAN
MDSGTGDSSISAHQCVRFSLADIQSATNNFDDVLIIGHGGFGKVYKGCFHTDETSQVVAVKRLDPMSNHGAREFRAEIEMLSKLRHRHLVSLIGFCDDNKEMILVYEYIPLGTLYEHLHLAYTPLSWVERAKIAIGAARGLDYLHTGTLQGVIHRDVKSSNILIDENWAARISDFGLSKIGPTNQSISYVDASVKGTFGLAVDERNADDQYSLVRWAQKCVKERKLSQMVDSNIKGTIFPKCLKRFAEIAARCVHSDPKERPTMTEVVASLQALLELQEKSNRSAESSGTTGFTWKINNYFVPATKPNSDQSGTNSPKSLNNNLNQLKESVIRGTKVFTYDELKLATRNFGNDTCLGEGRYGKVYKGWIDNTELPIAVKKLYRCTPFDLEMLNSFRHPNLVKLIGYCLEGDRLFLIYEFMHKGNLEDLLHSTRLPLVTKVKIVVEIAQGIIFLQNTLSNRTQPTVSESPLYRHKILLDEV